MSPRPKRAPARQPSLGGSGRSPGARKLPLAHGHGSTRERAGVEIALSSRYLELLSGKLIALLFDLFFQLIQVYRLSFFNSIFQKCPQVDLLEDNRILSQVFRYEFISFFQLHLLPETAWQLHSASFIDFCERHISSHPFYPLFS